MRQDTFSAARRAGGRFSEWKRASSRGDGNQQGLPPPEPAVAMAGEAAVGGGVAKWGGDDPQHPGKAPRPAQRVQDVEDGVGLRAQAVAIDQQGVSGASVSMPARSAGNARPPSVCIEAKRSTCLRSWRNRNWTQPLHSGQCASKTTIMRWARRRGEVEMAAIRDKQAESAESSADIEVEALAVAVLARPHHGQPGARPRHAGDAHGVQAHGERAVGDGEGEPQAHDAEAFDQLAVAASAQARAHRSAWEVARPGFFGVVGIDLERERRLLGRAGQPTMRAIARPSGFPRRRSCSDRRGVAGLAANARRCTAGSRLSKRAPSTPPIHRRHRHSVSATTAVISVRSRSRWAAR